MSWKKDKGNDNKKDGETPGSSSHHENIESSSKKGKNIRFQLAAPSVASEESFTSALSYSLGDGKEDVGDDGDDYEDFILRRDPNAWTYKRYIFIPLRHSSPRGALMNSCFRETNDASQFFLTPTPSSNQPHEILRPSPIPSDADMRLINATHLRKLVAVKEAILNGADVNTCTDGQTPLLIATEIGDARLVSYLLTVPNVNPDFQNHFGQTSLIIAVRNAFDKIVRLLLNHNADVNLPDNMGRTPLHAAFFQRRPGLAKLLLAYGANYEKPDCFDEKPMYTCVVKKPHLECLMTLLKMGSSPEYRNVTGMSLLSRAVLSGADKNILEALIKYGAAINSQDLISRKTPLHLAAFTNNLEITKLLIHHGADLNLRTTYNFSPLDEAIFHRSTDVKEYLESKTKITNPRLLHFHTEPGNVNETEENKHSLKNVLKRKPKNKKY